MRIWEMFKVVELNEIRRNAEEEVWCAEWHTTLEENKFWETYLVDTTWWINQFFTLNQVILEADLGKLLQRRLKQGALSNLAQKLILSSSILGLSILISVIMIENRRLDPDTTRLVGIWFALRAWISIGAFLLQLLLHRPLLGIYNFIFK